MSRRGVAGLILCLVVAISCARPNRVSRGAIARLTQNQEPFVLIFGSMLPAEGARNKPAIRFVHQLTRAAPQYVLHEMKITNGDRFYAILKPPAELKRIDQFETEVSWNEGEFDKINFVRLAQQRGAVAMYLGEIQMTLAERRDAPGRGILVTARDDFENAANELRRLYPRFRGEIVKAPMMRSPVPVAAPPKRASP